MIQGVATHDAQASLRPLLLVEDNPMDVELALQAFEDHHVAHPIVVSRDGEEALRYIAAHSAGNDPSLPVLTLLDLRLPKVDGLDVLRAARRHPTWKLVPFVVLTTSREDSDVRTAYELGVNAYLVKPADFGQFGEVVRLIKMFWLHTNQAPTKGGASG